MKTLANLKELKTVIFSLCHHDLSNAEFLEIYTEFLPCFEKLDSIDLFFPAMEEFNDDEFKSLGKN